MESKNNNLLRHLLGTINRLVSENKTSKKENKELRKLSDQKLLVLKLTK